MAKHTDGFRPMITELFPRVYAVSCATHTAWCSAVQRSDVLPYTWAVLLWISAPGLLFVLLVHMCGDSLLLCTFVQHRPRT
jgi:hypothetical protein